MILAAPKQTNVHIIPSRIPRIPAALPPLSAAAFSAVSSIELNVLISYVKISIFARSRSLASDNLAFPD